VTPLISIKPNNIFTKEKTPPTNTHKTKYTNQTGMIIAISTQQIPKFTSKLITH